MIDISQYDVLMVLRKHKNQWLTSTEIAESLGYNADRVVFALRKMRLRGEIEFKVDIGNKYIYKYKASVK